MLGRKVNSFLPNKKTFHESSKNSYFKDVKHKLEVRSKYYKYYHNRKGNIKSFNDEGKILVRDGVHKMVPRIIINAVENPRSYNTIGTIGT